MCLSKTDNSSADLQQDLFVYGHLTLGCGCLCMNELLYHCTLHAGNQFVADMAMSALPLSLLLANLGQRCLCYLAQRLRLSAVGTAVIHTPVHSERAMSRNILDLRLPCQYIEGQTYADTLQHSLRLWGACLCSEVQPSANVWHLTAGTAEHTGSHCQACNGACNKPPPPTMTIDSATAKTATMRLSHQQVLQQS